MHAHQTASANHVSTAFALAVPIRTAGKHSGPTCRVTKVAIRPSIRSTSLPIDPKMTTKYGYNNEEIQQSTSQSYTWMNNWFPVAFASDIQDKPYGFVVFSKRYVAIRDVNGQYTVFDDICPHRAAPLSEGQVVTRIDENGNKQSELECMYHGWRFNSCGVCVKVPQSSPEKRISSKCNLQRKYPTKLILDKLVLVYLGDTQDSSYQRVPVPQDLQNNLAKSVVYRCAARLLPVSVTVAFENVIDPSHVFWAHHGTSQANRNRVNTDSYVKVTSENGASFRSEVVLPPTKLSMHSIAPVHNSYRSRRFGQGGYLLAWYTPVSADTCLFFNVNAIIAPPLIFKTILKMTPEWVRHADFNVVLDGDTAVLRYQMDNIASQNADGFHDGWRQKYFLGASPMDSTVFRFRKWLDRNWSTIPFPEAELQKVATGASEKMDIRYINNRYEHHTKRCRVCSAALRNARRIRLAALLIGALLLSGCTGIAAAAALTRAGLGSSAARGLIRWAVGGVILLAVCVAVWAGCQKAIRSLEYNTKAAELQVGK